MGDYSGEFRVFRRAVIETRAAETQYCYRAWIRNRHTGSGARIEHIIYVHGLWMNGADGLVLRRRLEHESGMKTHAFHYRSVAGSMSDIVVRLAEFARGIGAERLHFVGHSLGGLVIYRTLEHFTDLPPGRVVFMGTPAVASRAAIGVAERLASASRLLGQCVAEELLTERSRRWQIDRELGIVAGTRRMGLGHFFTTLDGEHDGTVAVNETRLPGATDYITLPVGHMGLLMSARVARETCRFLKDGRFSIG
jgi:pimeloyl-ACP methyl ester carboxylesterase